MANSNVITIKAARPRLGHSSQAKWQKKQQAAGNCRACGKPRPADLKQLCRPCQDKFNAYIKERRRKAKEATRAQESVQGAIVQPEQEPSGGSN